MRKKLILTLGIILTLAMASPTLAAVTTSSSSSEDTDFKSIFESFTDGVEDTSQDLEEGGDGITLPTFADEELGFGIVIVNLSYLKNDLHKSFTCSKISSSLEIILI